jgi:hypothetical protein
MDVILSLAPGQAQEQQQGDVEDPAPVELVRFQAHSTLLSNSDVLRSRVSILADISRTCLDPRVSCLGVHASWSGHALLCPVLRCCAVLCCNLIPPQNTGARCDHVIHATLLRLSAWLQLLQCALCRLHNQCDNSIPISFPLHALTVSGAALAR